MFNTTDEVLANFIVKFGYTGIVSLPVFFGNFIISSGSNKKYHYFHYIIAIFFIISIWTTPYFINGFYHYFFGFYPKANLLHPVYLVWLTYLMVDPHYYLWKNIYKNSSSNPDMKNKIKIFLTATFIFMLSSSDFAANYGANYYPIGFIFITIGLILYVNAIIKYKFMDIDISWRHSLKNIIYFSLFFGSLFVVIFGISKHNNLLAFSSVFFLVILSYFKPKIDAFLYNIFLRKYKKIWDNLKKAGDIKNIIYDTNTLINILISDIPKALDISHAEYYRLDEASQKFIASGLIQENKPKDIFLDDSLVTELNQKQTWLYIHNLENKNLLPIFEKMQIELCYPIFYTEANQKILVGILVYGKKKDNSIFNHEDLPLLAQTVEKAEIHINNIIKIKHISNNYADEFLKKYKNTNQRILLDETKRLSEYRDLNLLCEQSKKVVQRLLNVKNVEIYLYDRITQKEFVPPVRELNKIKISEDNYLIKYLMQTNEIVGISDLKRWSEELKLDDFKQAAETAEKMNAKFIIPLTDKKLLGFFTIDGKMDLLEYTQDDFVFLCVIKNILEITVRNIYLNEKSQLDPLTKIYNRNFLDAILEEEAIRGFRECVPLSLLMIDGDNFKWFNDEKGHDAGDKILVALVNCIKSTIRPTDELCRYGGEEFVVICKGTDNEGALMLANRINQEFKINKEIVRLNKLYKRKITVSIGVSTFQNKESKINYTNQEIAKFCENLIKKSDKAMYAAKAAGKDQVCNSQESKNNKKD